MSSQSAIAATGSTHFGFLQELADELSEGRVDLPSFPEVAARVQQAIADPSSNSERIARIISADAGLASRILAMANSSLMRRNDTPVVDLKLAITRLGFQHVRSAALAYAAVQLRQAPRLVHIRGALQQLWSASMQVAAMARAIAGERAWIRTDEAMLAGLVHNIGKLYILSRAPQESGLSADPVLREELLAKWHAGIGQAIAENWNLSDNIAAAVGGQDDLQRQHEGPADLQDVLIASLLLVSLRKSAGAERANALTVPAMTLLGLDAPAINHLMVASHTELEMVNAALG